MVKARRSERAVDRRVRGQGRQRGCLGGGLGGGCCLPPSWGKGWRGDPRAGLRAACPEPSLGIGSKTVRSLQYLQIYLPLKSAQVYQGDGDRVTELCTHVLHIPPAIIPSSSYAAYLVHSSSMIIINMF